MRFLLIVISKLILGFFLKIKKGIGYLSISYGKTRYKVSHSSLSGEDLN